MRYLSVWSSSRLENGIHLVFTTPGGIFNPPQKAWGRPKHTGKIINDNFIIPGSLMVSYRLFAIMCFVYFQPLFEGGWKGFYLLPIIICEWCSRSVKHNYKNSSWFWKGLRQLINLDRSYCFNSIGHKYKPFVLYVLTPRNKVNSDNCKLTHSLNTSDIMYKRLSIRKPLYKNVFNMRI